MKLLELKGPRKLKVENHEPPIGLTARLSPKGLRYRFYFPEFQNRIEAEKKLKSKSPNNTKDQVNLASLRILPDFVKFCKQQNIAFSDSERLLFDIT